MSPKAFSDAILDSVARIAPISKSSKDPSGKFSSQNGIAIVVVSLLLALLPLDITELIFGILGAVIFAFLQSHHRESQRRLRPSLTKPAPHVVPVSPPTPAQRRATDKPEPHAAPMSPSTPPWRRGIAHVTHAAGRQPRVTQGQVVQKGSQQMEQPDANKCNSMPILPPTFCSTDWDGEVAELLKQIMPTSENEETVNQLARIVKRHLRTFLPNAEVAGYVSANFNSGKAFGVAVPEVDIVASMSPSALVARMRSSSGGAVNIQEERKILKWAIRGCTDRLVATGSFKFRRSAFKGEEPKVTLLAAPSLGLSAESIPMDFAVNVVTPLYNAALLTECGQMEPRAKELILLVKRWAKDRGICHAPKGHLPPYLWGILAIYFLQVECQLLPSLQYFKLSSSLMGKGKAGEVKAQPKWQPLACDVSKQSTAVLFKDFINFYTSKFDWRNEAISVRLGSRAAPSCQLPLHIILQDGTDSRTIVGPSIEDPFEARRNLGTCMTAESMTRLSEELKRADDFCQRGESLTKLLEPWAPESEATLEI